MSRRPWPSSRTIIERLSRLHGADAGSSSRQFSTTPAPICEAPRTVVLNQSLKEDTDLARHLSVELPILGPNSVALLSAAPSPPSRRQISAIRHVHLHYPRPFTPEPDAVHGSARQRIADPREGHSRLRQTLETLRFAEPTQRDQARPVRSRRISRFERHGSRDALKKAVEERAQESLRPLA